MAKKDLILGLDKPVAYLLGTAIAVVVLIAIYTTYFQAYGDTIYINNNGACPALCFGTWTGGSSFTLAPGEHYSFPVSNVGGRYTGMCYQPDTSYVGRVDIDTYTQWTYNIDVGCNGQTTTTTQSTTSTTVGDCNDDSYAQYSCNNNKKDCSETDVDCGGMWSGTLCDECALGRVCQTNGDCASNYCKNGVCSTPPTCESLGFYSTNVVGLDCEQRYVSQLGKNCYDCSALSSCEDLGYVSIPISGKQYTTINVPNVGICYQEILPTTTTTTLANSCESIGRLTTPMPEATHTCTQAFYSGINKSCYTCEEKDNTVLIAVIVGTVLLGAGYFIWRMGKK